MKLISIELKNFRQFNGVQKLSYATGTEKNVTLIHGENNGGKTALLNAMRWCLYDELTSNLLDKHLLINKHASLAGENTYHVFMQILHENNIYEIRRFMKNTGRVELRVYLVENGNYEEQSNPQYFVNSLLPKEMAGFFFYQGEGEGTLNSANDFKHVKSSIEQVLGFSVANKTIQHLSRIKNKFQRDLVELDITGESTRLWNLKQTLVGRVSENTKKVNKLSDQEKDTHENIDTLTKQILLSDIDVVKQKATQRNTAENLLVRIRAAKDQAILSKSAKLPSWVTNSFSKKLSEVDISNIDTAELKEKLKYTIDKKLINEIFQNASCICGSDTKPGSDAHTILSNISKYSVEPELKARWKRATELKQKLEGQSIKAFVEMKESIHSISQAESDEASQKDIVNELSTQLQGINISDLSRKEEQRDSYKTRLTMVTSQLATAKNALFQDNADLLDIEDKLHRLSLAKPQANKVEDLVSATDKVLSLYENELKISSNGVDDIILAKMKVLFEQVAFNGYSAAKDGHGAWRIIDANGQPVAAGNGYQAMLAISFIVSLIEFSKDRASDSQYLLTPGTIAPFIADSILAFIGPDNGRELVRFIAEAVEQCVFMFSQAQWTESHTDVGIRDKVGKEYNLVQHTVLTEEQFKGEYPTKLKVGKQQFDVVRFGSEFDKVTIEEVL